MARNVAEALEKLGVKPGISWNDLNQTYKDLVKVWHPDRFQHDQRLKERAGKETQAINGAMDILRKSYDPAKSVIQKKSHFTPPPPQNGRTQSFEERVMQKMRESIVPAPIPFYRSPVSAFSFLILGIISAFIAREAIYAPFSPMISQLGGVSFIFISLAISAKNAAVLISNRPLVQIDKRGLTLYETGLITWREIIEVSTTERKALPTLAIVCSKGYLARVNPVIRAKLRFHNWIRGAHLFPGWVGMRKSPQAAIHGLQLYQQIFHSLREVTPPPSSGARIGWWIAAAAATAPVLRLLFGFPVTEIELLGYGALFFSGFFWDAFKRLRAIPLS